MESMCTDPDIVAANIKVHCNICSFVLKKTWDQAQFKQLLHSEQSCKYNFFSQSNQIRKVGGHIMWLFYYFNCSKFSANKIKVLSIWFVISRHVWLQVGFQQTYI